MRSLANFKEFEPDGDEDRLEYVKLKQHAYREALAAQMSIRTRLNPNDSAPRLKELNGKVLSTLDDIQQHLNSNAYDEANKLLSDLHNAANPLLKEEWERVKRGEPAFVSAKFWAKLMIGITSLITLATILWLLFLG